MPPSILQLQSIGIQDVYLTKDPQINIFKYVYYRYVNFATDVVKLTLSDVASFNRRCSCTIPKRGHLLSKLYLHIKLPALEKKSGTYLSWSETLGYAIFSEPIELEIGGVVVDRLYPQFLDMWDDLSNANKQAGRNFMLNKSDYYITNYRNALKPYDLIIPLEFWFTKQYNSALPLLSMYNQDIKINFKFKDFQQVVNYDGGTDPENVAIIDSHVYAEYIFLDDTIVQQFQRQKHMYIIEQVQYNGDEIIPQNTTIYNTSLKYNHPVKELIFACAEKQTVACNNYFTYSNTTTELSLISEAALLLDGKQRFEFLPEFYYRSMFPDAVHSNIPMKYIYAMPFSLRPEDNQPTGSINMSRFNDVVLSLKLPPGNNECYLYVYAINYNILTIENGNFTLEWAT
jgi:hypothetical protein